MKDIIELIDKTVSDFETCEGGNSYFLIDGHEYHTDTGYAIDGICAFAEILKERLKVQNNDTTN